MSGLIYEEESFAIRGACFEVYTEKGCGVLESVYQECTEIELELSEIHFLQSQNCFSITSSGDLSQILNQISFASAKLFLNSRPYRN